MEYLIGVALAVVVCAFTTLVGFDRDRVFYPTPLVTRRVNPRSVPTRSRVTYETADLSPTKTTSTESTRVAEDGSSRHAGHNQLGSPSAAVEKSCFIHFFATENFRLL